MVVAKPAVWTLLVVLLLSAAPVQAQSPFPSCGELELVFRNHDLQPKEDGFVHASGQFFIQFQAIGEQADQIETFGFSFGPDSGEYDEAACDQPIWFTGPYVMNYRADRDASDGFFIPLKTDLVPDGTYGAAVHAYDSDHNELARFWARAVVKNCDDGATGGRCTDDTKQQTPHDTTQPWPLVLPGDGEAMADRHLSIEFAEPLSELRVVLNGEDITSDVTEWEGRAWDADNVPDYGPHGIGNTVSPPCTQPYHTCIHYGPAYEWNGRPLQADDVLRIEAADVAGNRVVKDLHVGSGQAGGAVTSNAPVLQVSVDEDRKITTPTTPVTFRFDMQNSGGGTAHPFTGVEAPEGWQAEFLPHSPIEPGERKQQELTVTAPAGTPPGPYMVNATISWDAGGVQKDRSWTLEVAINGAVTQGPADEELDDGNADKDSPAPPLVLPLLFLLVAGVLRRLP